MREIIFENRFNRDLKRMLKRGKNREDLLVIARLLAQGTPLPPAAHPHKLTGAWSEFWECHIESDWLLVYDVSDTEVLLVGTGTHADLFE